MPLRLVFEVIYGRLFQIAFKLLHGSLPNGFNANVNHILVHSKYSYRLILSTAVFEVSCRLYWRD